MVDIFASVEHPIAVHVNRGKNWLTKQIQPINQRLLVVDIAAAIVNDETTSLAGIENVHSLEVKPESEAVRLSFADFVCYAVTEEMFAQQNDEEVSTGLWLRIFSKSFFLDFVGHTTWATSDFPGQLVHYQINTLDHTVNVVTANPPEILKLSR
ncbi:hypothetical protein [Ruegeria halocynthiae]|uniref:hypothetical protein n=1 Tax=Ruegeria halocynthiae TaxID=985054 RepID=UPI00056BFC8C|nr:hypothetical protein [Ruegeria halocynthiae]